MENLSKVSLEGSLWRAARETEFCLTDVGLMELQSLAGITRYNQKVSDSQLHSRGGREE